VDPAHAIAAAAAHGYPVLYCQECAESIRKALVAAGLHGQFVELRASGIRPFIVCSSYCGGQISITRNGRHIGVRVGDLVFDNLHPNGMLYDEWARDFAAFGGFVISVANDF
jgi:hypothetical protein